MPRGTYPPPSPVRTGHKKMAAKGSHIDFMFLAPPPAVGSDAVRRLLPVLETEETRIKFCIAQRNFLVGGTILDNIIRSMRSRKVICVISPYFLQSKWCKEELLIAHQVQFHLPSFWSSLLNINVIYFVHVKCASSIAN